MLIEDLTPYLIGGLVGVGIGALIGVTCTAWLYRVRRMEAAMREPDWGVSELPGYDYLGNREAYLRRLRGYPVPGRWQQSAHPNWAAGPVDGEKVGALPERVRPVEYPHVLVERVR